jgi:hypothetical protein
VKLDIQTQALHRRYQIEDLRRQIRVTGARLAYDGLVCADRDSTVQDLQVIQGQTVATGQRLGTLAAPSPGGRMPRRMRQSGSALRKLIISPAAAGSGGRTGKAVEQGPLRHRSRDVRAQPNGTDFS